MRARTLNVGTMTGQRRELVDMIKRRKVDLLCVCVRKQVEGEQVQEYCRWVQTVPLWSGWEVKLGRGYPE